MAGQAFFTHFTDVLAEEHEAISARRALLGRRRYADIERSRVTTTEPVATVVKAGDIKMYDTVGLCLSGGGVRSASVCLGALQALDQEQILARIDYLSTVSGGGYMGAATVATMKNNPTFVFSSGGQIAGTGGAFDPADRSDTIAVRHLRNFSNYLLPEGLKSLFENMTILVRGWAASASLVMTALLIAAFLTLLCNATTATLKASWIARIAALEAAEFGGLIGWRDAGADVAAFAGRHYFATKSLLIVAALYILYWALRRSWSEQRDGRDAGAARSAARAEDNDGDKPVLVGPGVSRMRRAGFLLVALSLVAVGESLWATAPIPFLLSKALLIVAAAYFFHWALQRLLGDGSSEAADSRGPQDGRDDVGAPQTTRASLLLAALAIAAVAESQAVMIHHMLKLMAHGADLSAWLKTPPSLAAIFAALGAATAFAGRFLGEKIKQEIAKPTWTALFKRVFAQAVVIVGALALPLFLYLVYVWLAAIGVCQSTHVASCADPASYPDTPDWLLNAALLFNGWSSYPFLWLYGCAAALSAVVAWGFTPNANSLHRLYRDRLARAFIIDARDLRSEDVKNGLRDPAMLRDQRLSSFQNARGPYPILNAALNIPGSRYLNRRGRNAEFFTFTPHRVGSEATGFAATDDFERREPQLDLATAMSISGAAISSNMGAQSVKPLAFTLALLNLRLGYWIANPRQSSGRAMTSRKDRVYLLAEAANLAHENLAKVYLTDGGHIENLGLYALLRRRCQLIIVVDAEADQGYAFSSLNALQRYARIDLGVRLHFPWEEIRDSARSVDGAAQEGDIPAGFSAKGKHVAIGRIDYANNVQGWLVYIKSSLSGDENDIILDYKRRHPAFPHETTGDQFFSEEQFEVYRALGFHMLHGFLTGDTPYAGQTGQNVLLTGAAARTPYDEIMSILKLRPAGTAAGGAAP